MFVAFATTKFLAAKISHITVLFFVKFNFRLCLGSEKLFFRENFANYGYLCMA